MSSDWSWNPESDDKERTLLNALQKLFPVSPGELLKSIRASDEPCPPTAK